MTEAEHYELVVGPELEGTRVDVVLATALAGVSRTRAQRSIDLGDALVNGRQVKPSHRVRAGDLIEIELPEPPPTELVAEEMPLRIFFEDEWILVVDKPAGLVVHPGAGVATGTLANGILAHTRAAIGARGRPGIVHRIDKDTSGLLVVAKTEAALAALTAQFQERTVGKRYTALVHGRMRADAGQIDAPIARDPRVRVRMKVVRAGQGRPALTRWTVVERYPQTTLLDVEILTGRTHQIRVHMAAQGHPVVGDQTYGGSHDERLPNVELRRRVQALGRHFLHARVLAFDHPVSGVRLQFTSPLPVGLEELLEYLRGCVR